MGRIALLLSLSLFQIAGPAPADDVVVKPGPGDAFVVQDDTGTAERLRVDESSGDVTADPNGGAPTLFIDASSDRIGVGTSTPGSTLDVNGIQHFYAEFTGAQILAQATCTALVPPGQEFVFAVRRDCGGGVSCNDICDGLFEAQAGQLACFDALHVYANANQPAATTGVLGLKTLRYDTCLHTTCGPNYCCCSG